MYINLAGRDDSPAAAIDARVEYNCPLADFPH